MATDGKNNNKMSKSDCFSQFLAETRMYDTRGECVARSFLWLATWYLGTWEILNKKYTNSIAVNLFVIGFSFFLDWFVNVLNKDEVFIDSRISSRITIVIITIISLALLLMPLLYILSNNKSGFENNYFLVMFWQAFVLSIKPGLDFLVMFLFPKSIDYFKNVKDHTKSTDEKIDYLIKIMQASSEKGKITDETGE